MAIQQRSMRCRKVSVLIMGEFHQVHEIKKSLCGLRPYAKVTIFSPPKRCSFTNEQRLPQGLGNESPKYKQILAQNDIIKLALQ